MDGAAGTLSYEQALSKLEQIVQSLERGEGSLDEALSKFQEGMTLSRQCAERLTVAEEAIQKVVEQSGNLILEPFKAEESA